MRNWFLVVFWLIISCDSDDEPPFAQWLEPNEEFSGGAATVFDESENAFGHAAPNLTGNKDLEFVTGNSFFRRNWVTAPSSTSDLDGLGPLFNARSCGACHFKDGRGAPPLEGEEPLSLLFRLSRPGETIWEPIPDENYGGQFNPKSILDLVAEGSTHVTYTEQTGTYPDGSGYSLRAPSYDFKDLQYGDFPPDLMISPRIAPHMVGLGLLEAIDEEAILSHADEFDEDEDGISGRANYVFDRVNNKTSIGRFGWKANQPNVRQQVAGAFVGDIGITSSLFPDETCASNQEACNAINAGEQPELNEQILDRVTLYSSAIAVPKRRNWDDVEVLQGKALFNEVGCASCHIPNFTTAQHPDFPEFSGQPIWPYTDLLLHDMGAGLADNRPDGLATGTEWKTPPLWGIGLIQVVNDHMFLLHDGRARGIEEAILWHGGEAENITDRFKALSANERQKLIQFVESL